MSKELTWRGVVGSFYADDALREARMVVVNVSFESDLRQSRADDKHFIGLVGGPHNCIEKVDIVGNMS